MFVVPFIKRPLPNGLAQVWILLERNGTHLIETESPQHATAFAADNDIRCKTAVVDDLVLLASESNPNLAAFYSWNEVVPGTIPAKELWRPFLWTTDSEGLNPFLDSVNLSAKHTAHSVMKAILSLRDI